MRPVLLRSSRMPRRLLGCCWGRRGFPLRPRRPGSWPCSSCVSRRPCVPWLS